MCFCAKFDYIYNRFKRLESMTDYYMQVHAKRHSLVFSSQITSTIILSEISPRQKCFLDDRHHLETNG